MSDDHRGLPRNRVRFLVAAVGLTAVHAGLRLAIAGEEPLPILVSTLEPGAQVRLSGSAIADPDAPPDRCRAIVAFSPDCPFCRRAVKRERETARSDSFEGRLWLAQEDVPGMDRFLSRLPATSRSAIDADAFQRLGVRGVPSLFLMDGEGILRWVGPYRGDESEEELIHRCRSGGAVEEAGIRPD